MPSGNVSLYETIAMKDSSLLCCRERSSSLLLVSYEDVFNIYVKKTKSRKWCKIIIEPWAMCQLIREYKGKVNQEWREMVTECWKTAFLQGGENEYSYYSMLE